MGQLKKTIGAKAGRRSQTVNCTDGQRDSCSKINGIAGATVSRIAEATVSGIAETSVSGIAEMSISGIAGETVSGTVCEPVETLTFEKLCVLSLKPRNYTGAYGSCH